MLSKLKKAVVKWFIPKPQDLADIVAGAAAEFVNSSNKQDAIAKFVDKTQPVQEAQVLLAKWLADGKVDEDEKKELAAKLAPVIEELYKKVGV